ncbi:MBL fold metallo-hydrolase [Rhodoferax sp.]|uniref:MBL fold metallo-hydrolase n=1 Tax=Rhodoferax sp. TaxID=50421 RepID=UPI0027304860|nr:MBL fold metallo-hydrolase [Rhodoferax sp.]MDP1654932.1 MBL fold metallo-hydrolase [Hylemonella sp.]MDP1943528.1 MBL fold metallo-hydrolase [Rhodoferax sp.]
MPIHPLLPDDIRVFERGWLSSNNILLLSDSGSSLVDSGYVSHAAQTQVLLESVLGSAPLTLLVNTHLHSDHCGANAALQALYPNLRTLIPPGHSEQVRRWDAAALTYGPTGQSCPPFRFDAVLQAGSTLRLGQREWEIHAAPGHDPHSIILFEPELRLLISADALWENGFGVVFPEIEGMQAFDEVAETLDLIQRLQPNLVIPGHGGVFQQVNVALTTARQRLSQFVADPRRHARHAAKVLLKFKLLEFQRIALEDFRPWIRQTEYFHTLHRNYFSQQDFMAWADELLQDLVRAGAARIDGQLLLNQ